MKHIKNSFLNRFMISINKMEIHFQYVIMLKAMAMCQKYHKITHDLLQQFACLSQTFQCLSFLFLRNVKKHPISSIT